MSFDGEVHALSFHNAPSPDWKRLTQDSVTIWAAVYTGEYEQYEMFWHNGQCPYALRWDVGNFTLERPGQPDLEASYDEADELEEMLTVAFHLRENLVQVTPEGVIPPDTTPEEAIAWWEPDMETPSGPVSMNRAFCHFEGPQIPPARLEALSAIWHVSDDEVGEDHFLFVGDW